MTSDSPVSKKVRQGKRKFYIILFVLMFAMAFVLVLNTSLFSVKNIIVLNNINVPDKEIINYSGIYIGKNIFYINLKEVKNKINKHPYIKDTYIKRKYPDEIVIEVLERNISAVLECMGIYFYIDKEGYILKTDHNAEGEIIIKGFQIDNFIEGDRINIKESKALETAIKLSEFIINSSLKDIVYTINYNDDIIELFISDNFKAKFNAKDDNLHRSYNNFLNIYADLVNKGVTSGIIDLSSQGYPVYKPFGE